MPSTDGEGAEYVTGTDTHSGTGGTEKKVGDVTQTRGVVITATIEMNDPRVSGTGTGLVNADFYDHVGPEWGTTRLENAGGAWEGTVTGVAWADGNASDLSGWLVGSGAYEGYTYYWHLRAIGTTGTVDGIIYPAVSGPVAPAAPGSSRPRPVGRGLVVPGSRRRIAPPLAVIRPKGWRRETRGPSVFATSFGSARWMS